MRAGVWTGVVATVAAAAAVVASTGSAETDTAENSGVLIATGKLVDDRGRPQSGELRAYVLPTGGPRIQTLHAVASTEADSTGRFELRIENPHVLAELSRRDGSADLTVHAYTRAGFGVMGFSSRIERWAGAFAASLPAGAASLPEAQFGVRSGVPEIRVETGGKPEPLARAAHPCQDQGDVGAPKLHRRDVYKKGMIIGELNNAYPDTRADFHYGERADSWVTRKLLFGVKDIRFGGWDHVDNSVGVKVGRTDARGPYARRMRSKFLYVREVWHVCPYPGSGSTYTEVRPLRWSGGLTSRRQSGTTNVCYGGNDYRPGTYFERASRRAVKWGRGVELDLPGVTVGLESISGFSRWVRVRYEFGDRVRNHRLCGSGGRDESVAGRIFSGRGRPPT